MMKYGQLTEDIRFEQDGWVLVVPAEDPDGPGLDCVHGCALRETVQWSYCLPDDPACPGCGKRMPDNVQGLYAMSNFDGPARFPGGWIKQEIARKIEENCKALEKELFIQAFNKTGPLITGITEP
jgi:hypothetical protein